MNHTNDGSTTNSRIDRDAEGGKTMFKLVDTAPQSAVIKVVGVGGGGGNAVEHMLREDVEGVDFICANTDAQALHNLTARTLLQLGSGVTKGLGAGANPDMGKDAALEDKDRIAEVLDGADMVFVTAGMDVVNKVKNWFSSSHH